MGKALKNSGFKVACFRLFLEEIVREITRVSYISVQILKTRPTQSHLVEFSASCFGKPEISLSELPKFNTEHVCGVWQALNARGGVV
jgi:hypothetical protein